MMRGTGPVPAVASLASPAAAEPCKDGMVHAVDNLSETPPGVGSFIEVRGPQFQQTGAALPAIFEVRNRTGRWYVPDEGPMLLRAYIDAVDLAYRQNRRIGGVLHSDLAFERAVAAKMKTALAAHGVHFALYAAIVLMPITGALTWWLDIELAAEFHRMGPNIIYALVAAHVGGALYQHLVARTDVRRRMLRRKR